MIISKPIASLRRIFFDPSLPSAHRRNFTHLYLEVAWFGLLSGSAVNFLNVYLTRLGASGLQLGLLTAMPAVVNLLLSIPFGQWLRSARLDRAVFWIALLYRIGYIFWVPLPWLLDAQGQIWALIGITLLMGIPLTGLGLAFNALFAGAVPADWRAHVVGVRNVLQALTFLLASLGCGALLDLLPFPLGYQVVFGLGLLGAAMSTLHLYFIRISGSGNRPAVRGRNLLRLDIWKTGYRRTLLVMLAFHFTQYLPIPLFSLYMVNALRLTDADIGLGTALFYLSVLVGSTRLGRMVRGAGHQKITGWGALLMAVYPAALALSRNPVHYYLISAVGGFSWAMVGGAYANYLLERIPEDDRPGHLAWYNLVLNASALAGTLIGPLLAGRIGLAEALLLIGSLRFLAGLSILKWG